MLDRDGRARRRHAIDRVIQNRMFARALLLLLLVLNAGVAAWWLLRPAPPPVATASPPAAPPLRLVGEPPAATATAAPPEIATTQRAAPAVASAVPSTMEPSPTAQRDTAASDATRCLRLGPFPDDSSLAHAQSMLQPLAARVTVATVPSPGRGWRVWLPPLADRAAAQALAARIAAAGFSDYYVVPGGDEANSIALGRYGNEGAAQRRQAQLQAAGFAAQAQALGIATRWLDIATSTGADDAALRLRSGAGQSRVLDCSGLH